ncbi:MAG: hypothetical protein AB8G86_27975, partial [Saprospiraceae bacterium]
MIKKMLPHPVRQAIHILLRPRDFYWLRKKNITYAQDLLYTHHSAGFLDDERFMEAYEIGKALDSGILLKGVYDIHWRMHTLCWAANMVAHLEGDFVDCGVCGGMYARTVMHYIGFQALAKKYYLLDTFTGLDPKYSSDAEMVKNEKFG